MSNKGRCSIAWRLISLETYCINSSLENSLNMPMEELARTHTFSLEHIQNSNTHSLTKLRFVVLVDFESALNNTE